MAKNHVETHRRKTCNKPPLNCSRDNQIQDIENAFKLNGFFSFSALGNYFRDTICNTKNHHNLTTELKNSAETQKNKNLLRVIPAEKHCFNYLYWLTPAETHCIESSFWVTPAETQLRSVHRALRMEYKEKTRSCSLSTNFNEQ
jgi:hypothetical protein